MNEMSNILIRMRELTVQSATDTVGEQERSFLNKEYVSLVDEMDRIAKSTEFNSRKLFDPESELAEYVIQVGYNGSEPVANIDTISVNLEGLKFSSESLGLGKENELGSSVVGEAGPARSEIASKLEVVDLALYRLASERATIGAIQNRLGSAISNLGISIEAQETSKSRIKDVDFAQETANLTQARIMTQSTASVLMQANQTPELALSLLRS
jgi:flagellin